VAGRGEQRLERARKLGAEQTIVIPHGSDMVKVITDASRQPFDVVIEAVGQPETWEAAVQVARKGGSVNFFGGCPSGTVAKLDTGRLHYGALTLLASFHHTPATFRQALSFIEKGLIRAADFVDGDCTLEDLPELFKSMAVGNRAVKTLVRVNGKP
jgi:L-iditol 2-dehydrogenase